MASYRAGDYKKSLRTWDEPTRTFTIDTADNTTSLGTETFYILMTTRGNKKVYYPVETLIVCGKEKMYHPTDPVILILQQNSTWPKTNHTVQGFISDMPRLCNITTFTIEQVIDENNNTLLKSYWNDYFAIDNYGNFTFKKTDVVYNHMIVHVSANTALIKSETVWTLNVSVVPFFSVNTNAPPHFYNVKKLELETQTLFINYNYIDSPYKLPQLIDLQGN